MQAENASVSIAGDGTGLGRAVINQHGQIKPVAPNPPSSPPQSSDSVSSHFQPPVRKHRSSISERSHEFATKLKKILHVKEEHNDEERSKAPILAESTIATSSTRLEHDSPVMSKPTVKDILHDPINTAKEKLSGEGSHQVAANIAANEISHGQAVDLIQAQDRVELANTDNERLLAVQNRDNLIKERQAMYVRWTMDRHVTKCRVLPRSTLLKKPQSAFESENTQGETSVDWKAYGSHCLDFYAHQYGGQYIGYGSDPPQPSKESIMPNLERVIIASAPLQELIMTMRKVYRWEDRMRTSKYLIVYFLLWYCNMILPGMLSAIVWLVIYRYFNQGTIEDVRKAVKRIEDRDQTALNLTEFIEKEGHGMWTSEILQQLGPWLMVQLCDAANMFEVIDNFYEWTVPTRTLATLVIFILGTLFTAFAPAWLLMKFITFSAGFAFFGLFPLACNFPEYRLLTSLPRRLFWNIPTHGDWAIMSLQAEGSRFQNKTQSDVEHPKDVDYGSYTAHYNSGKGRIVMSAASVHFEANIGHKLVWKLGYDEMSKLEKIDRIASKTIANPRSDSGMDLLIVSKVGDKYMLSNMDGRDQVFSQLIGFSNIPWQIVW